MFLALRWRSLMPGEVRHVKVGTLTILLLIGTLLNYALPGPVGEVVAAAMAARRFKLTTEAALAAGIHARFVGLGVAGLVALLLMLAADMPLPDAYKDWVFLAAGVIGVGVIVLALLSSRPELLRAVSRHTAGRIVFLKSLDESVARFCEAMAAVGELGWRRYAIASAWALCGHSCIIGGILIAAYGLGSAPSIAGLAFTYAVATAGAVVLFAFPGSQVGWDGMLAGLMVATAGVAVPDALVLALLVRLQQLLLVVCGAFALLALPKSDT
jgi:hypothetical protein